MHKLISTTFKILICSMLFMFLLDTSLLLVEVISIHSKVSNMTGLMQMEIARNNYMPENMANTFQNFLEEMADDYSANGTREAIISRSDIVTNFSELDAGHAKDYGDIQDLKIKITLHPAFVYYNSNRTNDERTFLKRADPLKVDLEYNYKVPCLRYLK